MKEKVQDTYISIFYTPAPHILHLKQIHNKTPAQTLEHLKEVYAYIKDLDVDIQTITTDQGNEYKGVYEEYLFETGI